MWSQIYNDIAPRKRSTYRVILEGAWEGKTYANIAASMQYSEVYLRQDLAPEVWTFLSDKFGVHISKKTLKTNLTNCYDAVVITQPTAEIATPLPKEVATDDALPSAKQPPFGDIGCIASDERFFDRIEILRDVFEHLRNSWNVSLVGDRQVGKSSLLAKVCRHAPTRLGISTEQMIYLDMEFIHTEETFFQCLCKAIRVDYCRGYDLLEATQSQKYILCIDEIEKMRNPSKFSGDERNELRGLSDGRHMPFTLVTASRTPLDELFPDDQYATSPFFNIFQQIQLPVFSEEVASQFLKNRLQGSSVQFSDDQIQTLIQNSGGHPAKLQQLAKNLYSELSQALG